MGTQLVKTEKKEISLEKVIMEGDLQALSPNERLSYYHRVCDSLGLNPLTKPFDYIRLNGKLTLYARKDATEQLRKVHKVSLTITKREFIADMCIVDVEATLPDGRKDFATGAVSVAGLKGDQLANAIMKAETKAKRRATLSICGLGFTDESEVESIPTAQPVAVDYETGEVDEPFPELNPNPRYEKAVIEAGSILKPVEKPYRRPITEKQAKRLYALTKASNIPNESAKQYLNEWNYNNSSEIAQDDYEQICTWAQMPWEKHLEIRDVRKQEIEEALQAVGDDGELRNKIHELAEVAFKKEITFQEALENWDTEGVTKLSSVCYVAKH